MSHLNKPASASSLLLCVGIAASLCLTACRQQAPHSRAEDEQTIRDLDVQWSRMAGTRDVEKTMAFYSDDAVLLPPNEPIVTGKEALRASWATLLSPANSVSWTATRIDVAQSGELAYVVGTYQLTSRDAAGKTAVDHGKVLEVFKKQTDGAWKAVADMYNSDLPAPPA